MSKIETNVVKPSLTFYANETNYTILDGQYETILVNSIQRIENFLLECGVGFSVVV